MALGLTTRGSPFCRGRRLANLSPEALDGGNPTEPGVFGAICFTVDGLPLLPDSEPCIRLTPKQIQRVNTHTRQTKYIHGPISALNGPTGGLRS